MPDHSVSCCTKWAPANRGTTDYEESCEEWRFEYNHIFVAGNLSGPLATELAYAYPGVAQACSDPYCTGEDPPGNATALDQGSWQVGSISTSYKIVSFRRLGFDDAARLP